MIGIIESIAVARVNSSGWTTSVTAGCRGVLHDINQLNGGGCVQKSTESDGDSVDIVEEHVESCFEMRVALG